MPECLHQMCFSPEKPSNKLLSSLYQLNRKFLITMAIFELRTDIDGNDRKSSLIPRDHLSLDRSPNIGPLISLWELDKFKNCSNKSFRTSKILTLLHQQVSHLLFSQRDMSGPRLRELSNDRWLGGNINWSKVTRYSQPLLLCIAIEVRILNLPRSRHLDFLFS